MSSEPGLDRRSPTPEGEDRLTGLPTELLLGIFSQLSVREMCRLRSLSRRFRDLIDTNQGALTQSIISHQRARINNEYNLLTDLADCDIIDALRRYDSHYGLAAELGDVMPSFRKRDAVTPAQCFNWFQSHHLPAAEDHHGSTLYLNWFQSHHLPAAVDQHETSTWARIYSSLYFSEAPQKSIEHRLAEGAQLHYRIRKISHRLTGSDKLTGPDALMAELKQSRSSATVDTVYAAFPYRFITKRKMAVKYIGPLEAQKSLSRYWEESELQQLLGLPDLKSKKGSLAYCTSSKKTAGLVRKAKEGTFTALEQAVIIGDIFIF